MNQPVLIKNISVITMKDSKVVEAQDVLIVDEKIKKIDNTNSDVIPKLMT